ncbi:MAG: Uma2 family endonuclease [Deltaproteobacteria bacterium]|nr:Uma2 family endonuclease [Deltaproteobacteria bacterium]
MPPLPPGWIRPPTEDELPYDDGEPMESELHYEQMHLLKELIERHLGDREDVCVGSNMAVYYTDLQAVKNDLKAPDVFVALGVERRTRKSYVAWREGKTPDVVIELLSESTEANDRGEKKRVYERLWRLPEYYLYTPDGETLEGFFFDPGRRELAPVPVDARGRIQSVALGCTFGVWEGAHRGRQARWLRIWDAQGTLVPSSEERADDERRRADDERRRADDERRRADDERRRADDERRRADDLAGRIAAYEARFGKLPDAGG